MSKLSLFAVVLAVVACKDPAKDVAGADVAEPAKQEVAPAEAPKAADGAKLVVSPENSKVGFVGSKVTGSHEGGFNQFSGGVTLGDTLEASSVALSIQMDSTFSDSEKLTGHLKSPDFFDVAKFPTAGFKSTGITAKAEGDRTHVVAGDLTLHGVTKSISFPAKLVKTDAGVQADAEFSINRKDFGIVYPGMPDDLIRDGVVIKLAMDLK